MFQGPGPVGPPTMPMAEPSQEKGRSAMPPQCPRCDMTKAQFNKVIQNYQKAYRKKVEGLKTELKATRNTIDLLRGQVKDLKKVTRVHIPSLAVGVLAGVFLKALAQAAKTLQSRLKSSEVQDSQDTEAAHDDHATSETEHAQELSSGQPA